MVDLVGIATRRVSPLGEVRAAIAFLTRVPVRLRPHDGSSTGAAAFPIVGAAIGAAGAVPLVVAGSSHGPLVATVTVGVVAVIDGGLHIDGLADTVDALAAPPGASERARTDPRVGSAGVVGIVVVLALEVVAARELAGRGPVTVAAALIVAGAVSRAVAPVLAVTIGRRRPPAPGLGVWFAERVPVVDAVVAAVAALLVVAAATIATAAALGIGAVAGAIVATVLVVAVLRGRGQVDGDGYGFAIEATFGLVLVGIAVAT